LAVAKKELKQVRKNNQALARYINTKSKKEEVRKKADEEARKKSEEDQSSKDV
jgi:hypothetical protein